MPLRVIHTGNSKQCGLNTIAPGNYVRIVEFFSFLLSLRRFEVKCLFSLFVGTDYSTDTLGINITNSTRMIVWTRSVSNLYPVGYNGPGGPDRPS